MSRLSDVCVAAQRRTEQAGGRDAPAVRRHAPPPRGPGADAAQAGDAPDGAGGADGGVRRPAAAAGGGTQRRVQPDDLDGEHQ